LLSGVFRFPVGRFLLSNITGAIVWSVSMGCLGYFLSASWRRLLHFFSRMDIAIGIAFGITVLVLFLRQWRQGRKQIADGR
jgi:membrane protein DedA with SNARE-associated domain